MRAYQHPIAARLIRRFDDKLIKILQYMLQIRIVGADVSWDVGKDWLLLEVKSDHLRHVSVDDLIIRDARSRRVGQRNVPSFVNLHQAGNAQHGIASEREWIEKIVVDAPVND